MDSYDVYKDIETRTGGDIYIGVVGPVRTGKSTFISKMMDLLVMPNIADENDRTRVTDELPQSGAGKAIMTTQPKFVPNESVEVTIDEKAKLRIRMVDCVGFMVDGATGYAEEGGPRMVRTPWYDYDIPFEEAAEIGTKKVITDHSTIGVIVTSDGSFTDISREAYIPAERRTINELKKLNKPFIVILNTRYPGSDNAVSICENIKREYDCTAIPLDLMNFTKDEMNMLLADVLYEFPVTRIDIDAPGWLCSLGEGNRLMKSFMDSVDELSDELVFMRDYEKAAAVFEELDWSDGIVIDEISLSDGRIIATLDVKREVFFTILEEECGRKIEDDSELMAVLKEYSAAKTEYDAVKDAMGMVERTGYGIVTPKKDSTMIERPELVKQGSNYVVRLAASAPSIHMIRVNVGTEVMPFVGSEKQAQDLVEYLNAQLDESPEQIWDTDIFGKPLLELIDEGFAAKITNLPDDARDKLRQTLSRIVNEGDGGMLCILL